MLQPIRINRVARTILLLGLLASLLSFAKFDHCRNSNWAAPDLYVHACYSDIPTLFTSRALDVHQWAFVGAAHAVEYPVLTGAVMWATSWIVPSGASSVRNYFDVNVFLLALLFIGSCLLVWKLRPQFAYLLPLSPAVIASLYINWDLWGIVTMLAAIYFFDRGRLSLSSTFLAVSIATKFFPVFLLIPVAIIFWRRNEIRSLLKFLASTTVVWLAINLPVMVTTPQGWWHFYKLNLDRGTDWGSLWYALSLLGINIRYLNYITILSLLAVVTATIVFLLELRHTPTLAQVSFVVLAAVLCVGKVYSPQYVLWLVPLAVISLQGKNQLHAFWIWQAGEGIYHLAIWQHLALVQNSHFGLPDGGYALATLVRIATSIYFIAVLVRGALETPSSQAQDSRSRLADFLFGGASSYP